MSLHAQPYRLVPAPDRTWPLEPPEKFYRVSQRSVARYQNADFLATFAVEIERQSVGAIPFGPPASSPAAGVHLVRQFAGGGGVQGENAIACLLSAQCDGRKLARGPAEGARPFAEFIARWLMDLGVIESFEVQQIAPGPAPALAKYVATSGSERIWHHRRLLETNQLSSDAGRQW